MKYLIKESRLEKIIIDYLDEYEDNSALSFYSVKDGSEILNYYFCEHFTIPKDDCPLIHIEVEISQLLESTFGDLWKEPFKKWFEKHFNLRVKSIYT